MDIGTGKDLDEYEVDGNQIPYHLIDIHLPGYLYNIAEFQADFATVFESIHQKSKFPILCGGSGLYIETALRGHSFLGIPSDAIRRQQLETLTSNEIDEWYQKLPTSLTDKLNAKTDKRKIRAIIIDEYLKQHPDWKPRSLPDVKPLIVGVDIDRDLRRDKIIESMSEYGIQTGIHYQRNDQLSFYKPNNKNVLPLICTDQVSDKILTLLSPGNLPPYSIGIIIPQIVQ